MLRNFQAAMDLSKLPRWFPLWAVLGSALAYAFPKYLLEARASIVPLLGIVMFGMGMTLSAKDFVSVLRRPGMVFLGVSLQYLLMPFIGWVLAGMAGLSAGLMAGVVLLGSCPGGTASNVICYLAGGDVALSITLTAVSTLLAVLATPLLTWLYVGERIPVPVLALLQSTAKIVLIPVILGLAFNHVLGKRLETVRHVFPVLSMLAIVFIIAIIVAMNRNQMGELVAGLLLVVILHNLCGLALGYYVPRLLGRSEIESRTLAIEVGMQNSGLAVALATQHFSAAAALPGALFSIWHNLSGSWLAGRWSQRSVGEKDE
jgi:BASS family bile acid:Na+ symporter